MCFNYFLYSCSYDFLEIIEFGLENATEPDSEEWATHEHGFGSENEVTSSLDDIICRRIC